MNGSGEYSVYERGEVYPLQHLVCKRRDKYPTRYNVGSNPTRHLYLASEIFLCLGADKVPVGCSRVSLVGT